MHFWPWAALSVDSLIVAIALSTTRPWRHALPLIALFGICDAAASTIGPTLGIQMTTFGLLLPTFLVLWGGVIMLNLPSIALRCRSRVWVYLLPPLLSMDNLILPGRAPAAEGLISSAMAAVGFAIGLALLGSFGSRARTPEHRLAGASLAAAGLLLAM